MNVWVCYCHNNILCVWIDHWFRFHISWLKKEYRDKSAIENSLKLTDEEKEILLGVHERDYATNGYLPEEPSLIDYDTLNKAYAKQEQWQVSIVKEFLWW